MFHTCAHNVCGTMHGIIVNRRPNIANRIGFYNNIFCNRSNFVALNKGILLPINHFIHVIDGNLFKCFFLSCIIKLKENGKKISIWVSRVVSSPISILVDVVCIIQLPMSSVSHLNRFYTCFTWFIDVNGMTQQHIYFISLKMEELANFEFNIKHSRFASSFNGDNVDLLNKIYAKIQHEAQIAAFSYLNTISVKKKRTLN